jgi:hypothetical protein
MAPGKGRDDKDNPVHISGEIKDWPTFKEAIQSHADARDTTWLLEAGRTLALFFARQIKDKTGSTVTRKKTIDCEKVKLDSNHVPTSVNAYNNSSLEEWFDDRDLATDLQQILFCNGNLTSALAWWWRRLWAGSECGGSGRAPGWCGWAVASLLRRCCAGPFAEGQSSVF